NRRVVGKREPQVPTDNRLQPMEILHRERVVEPVAAAKRRQHVRRDSRVQFHFAEEVARGGGNKEKGEDRNACQDQKGVRQPAGQIAHCEASTPFFSITYIYRPRSNPIRLRTELMKSAVGEARSQASEIQRISPERLQSARTVAHRVSRPVS